MNKFLRMNDVVTVTSLSRSTVCNLVKEGSFPKPISIEGRIGSGRRMVAWVESEVQDWIENQIKTNRLTD